MKKFFIIFSLFIFQQTSFAQDIQVYPSNWWIGMKWDTVQILIHGNGDRFNEHTINISYPGVKVLKVQPLENPNYYAVDIHISQNAQPGNVSIVFTKNKKKQTINWPIKARRSGAGKQFTQGVTNADIIYLAMPDRFSNGDESNDRIKGMRDQSLNRDSMYHRHGGDLKGIINHLDYLKDLGVTTLWMTPIWENDMPNRTEHGYAITNHYKVDPRLGGNDAYHQLGDELHKRGMKLIQDAVYNHVGLSHFTVIDKPTKDWLNEWPSFTQTSYKDQVLFDPYAAPSQIKQLSDGWFTREMPDLNQKNPYVANFLIQHALWSVEEFAVDGWRIDTYIYNDLNFMNRCNAALYEEYPNITLFGETWLHGVPNQSYFCENNLNIPFKSNLQATTDFQTLFYGIQTALNEKFSWTDGVNKLYTVAAQDFMYKDPSRQVIFLDNHDLPRFFSIVGEDTAKYKIALSWLFTFRGIPQMYYGMEILMTGFTNPDGLVRSDFPGGWKNDTNNKFTSAGRTAKENSLFNHIRTLARFRNKTTALQDGKMMQYFPEDGMYVYFRYNDEKTIMCIMNTSDKPRTIELQKDFIDRTAPFTKAKNILTEEIHNKTILIPAMEMFVLELQ